MDFDKIIDLSKKLGPVAILLLVIAAAVAGYIVPGPTYQEALKQRDDWRDLALKAARLGEAAAGPHVIGMPPPTSHTLESVQARVDALDAQIKGR